MPLEMYTTNTTNQTRPLLGEPKKQGRRNRPIISFIGRSGEPLHSAQLATNSCPYSVHKMDCHNESRPHGSTAFDTYTIVATNARSRRIHGVVTQNKARTRRRTRVSAGDEIIMDKIVILTFLSLVTWLMLGLQYGSGVEASVVRPTIFSGYPGPDSGAPSPQQQQQQQPSPSTQPLQQQPHLPTLSDGSQLTSQAAAPNTKIQPPKSRFCHSASGQRLDTPLGLQSGAIDDLSLSASSSSQDLVGPQHARLNLDGMGGAWCPMKPISLLNFGKEWIQVKLNRSFVVNAIETQGRYGNGNGKEFVPGYQIEYSRNGGQTWHKWKDVLGLSLLRANENVNTAVKNELSPPIVGANVIRILPFSQSLRTVCLRFELHGCPYDEGAPIAYATNDGVVEQRWGHLMDHTYDGLRRANLLSQGLGQLVDGVKGPDNFSHNSGFEWVGWKSMNGDVVLEFTFKTVRNFTGALFHSNNLFSSGVEVFQAVDVAYGIDAQLAVEPIRDQLAEQRRRQQQQQHQSASPALRRPHEQVSSGADPAPPTPAATPTTLWSTDVLSIEYEPDKKSEASRPVTVHLKQRLANKLRFTLKFASKWILVSEVEFLSHPVELLSLDSLTEADTPPLIGALSPARTYDQFVAILREHQLRSIASKAYLESFAGPDTPSSGGETPNSDQGTWSSPSPSSASSAGAPEGAAEQFLFERRFPASLPGGWPAGNEAPATNPMLSQAPPVAQSQPPPPPTQQQQPNLDLPALLNQQLSPSQSRQADRSLGLTTVISLLFAAFFVIVGLLFALSSYRLRSSQQRAAAKLAAHAPFARHLQQGASSKALATPFVNVFSSASNSSASSAGGPEQLQHQVSTTGSAGHHLQVSPNVQQQQQIYHTLGLGDYNTIFASPLVPSSSTRPSDQLSAAADQHLANQQHLSSQQQQQLHYTMGPGDYNTIFSSPLISWSGGSSSSHTYERRPHRRRAANPLKRLATLASSRSCARQPKPPPPPPPRQPNTRMGQLLVSVKDCNSNGGFQHHQSSLFSPANQLIVGLNQATANHMTPQHQQHPQII